MLACWLSHFHSNSGQDAGEIDLTHALAHWHNHPHLRPELSPCARQAHYALPTDLPWLCCRVSSWLCALLSTPSLLPYSYPMHPCTQAHTPRKPLSCAAPTIQFCMDSYPRVATASFQLSVNANVRAIHLSNKIYVSSYPRVPKPSLLLRVHTNVWASHLLGDDAILTQRCTSRWCNVAVSTARGGGVKKLFQPG